MRCCGIHAKPSLNTTESALDTNLCPPNYAGVNCKNTPGDPKAVANDLFNFSLPMNYPGTPIPLYPQPAHYGVPMEIAPQYHYSFPPSSYPTLQYPHSNPITACAMPLPYQYMMWNPYAQFYNNALTKDTCSNKGDLKGTQKNSAPAKGNSSSNPSVEVLNGCTQCKKRPLNQKDARNSPDVACLNSSLKMIKVEEGLLMEEIPDENQSSYFSDISSILSDGDQATDDDVKDDKMNTATLPLSNAEQSNENGGNIHLSDLNVQEKNSLDVFAEESSAHVLLSDGYKSIAETIKTTQADGVSNTSPCEFKRVISIDPKKEVDYVSSIDSHGIDSRISSNAKNPYYLPSQDGLLKIGIKGTVEFRIGKEK